MTASASIMPDSCVSQTTPSQTCFYPKILGDVVLSGLSASSFAVAGYIFGVINPAGGAIFGIASWVAFSAGTALSGKLEEGSTWGTALKAASYVARIIGSFGAGFLITCAVGFPITATGAAVLFTGGATVLFAEVGSLALVGVGILGTISFIAFPFLLANQHRKVRPGCCGFLC